MTDRFDEMAGRVQMDLAVFAMPTGASGEHGKALRVWQEWAATLLDEHGRQPLHGQHGDEPAREVIAQLVGLAPGVPRCSRCGCFSTRHEVDDEELRECADCECEEYEP